MEDGIKRILVPVDFSPGARAALDFAQLLAARFGSTIDVLHVFHPPDQPPETLVEPPAGAPRATRVAGEQAWADLDRFLDGPRRAGAHLEGRVEYGDPAFEIVRVAGEEYDLVVMATHGRTGWSHVKEGSVAEQVVRRAPCPVATVRLGAPIGTA